MSFWIIGYVNPQDQNDHARLAVCSNLKRAEAYVATLDDAEDGRYYIDGPCIETIEF